MWSGPRNISTALMRSFGNRPDSAVCDEPLYAYYLVSTGARHPGADEVIAAQETDWRKVVDALTGPVPGNKAIFYQKHMAHHLLPSIERDWLGGLTHAFLIRDPKEMLTSLMMNVPHPTLEDTGLPQQMEILHWMERTGLGRPPVIDSRDVLLAPEAVLRDLCAAVEIPFDRRMLRWKAGPRATDGVWAPHWYAAVERSTGFRPYAVKRRALPERLNGLYRRCLDIYHALHEQRIGRRE